MMMRILPEKYKGYFFKRFSLVSLIAVVVLFAVFALGINLMMTEQMIVIKADQKRKVISEKNLLEHLLDEAVLDLRVMTDSRMFKTFFSESFQTNPFKGHFDELMKDLMEEKLNYYQIRFLDSLGMEIFRIDRINGKPHICSVDELQDKKHRYYFQNAIALEKGSIYISPLDLNIEHGEIEVPFRPMIRVCIPVFNEGEKAIGVNVLNFDGTHMLDELNVESATGFGNTYLINRDGYFLNAPDSELEWGFMMPNKNNITIKTIFPGDYEKIFAMESGQFKSARGLYTVETADPFAKLGEHVFDNVEPKGYSWKIISFIPESQLLMTEFIPLGKASLLFLGALAAALALAYLYSNVSVRKKMGQLELAESEENLRVANQTKDQFFSMMSHDLKNASGTIAFYLDFIKQQYEEFSKEEIKSHLNDVTDAAAQHNKLLYEILDWGKLQLGRTEFKPEDISVAELLEDQKALVELSLKNKGIEMEIQTDLDSKIVGDREMIKTVLRNLINNAIKFSNRDSKISLIAKEKGEKVEIKVVDTGVGMRKEDATRIFDLNSKIQRKGTENEAGTGFGLKMVGELVLKNRGTIRVESELGEGFSFIMNFPASK